MWVFLHCSSRSEWLEMHPACESFSTFQADWNGWTSIKCVSSFPVFVQIKTTDKKDWTCIQCVSPFPVFEQIRNTDKNCWKMHPVCEYLFHFLRRSEALIRMAELASSMWVPLQCLDRSEPLTRILECVHPECEFLSTVWSEPPTWTWAWTCIQFVSPSPLFVQIRASKYASRVWVPLQCLSSSE